MSGISNNKKKCVKLEKHILNDSPKMTNVNKKTSPWFFIEFIIPFSVQTTGFVLANKEVINNPYPIIKHQLLLL